MIDKCKQCEYVGLYESKDRPLFCCSCELNYHTCKFKEEIKDTKWWKSLENSSIKIVDSLTAVIESINRRE